MVEKGLGALLGISTTKTVLDNLSVSEQEYVFNVAMTGKADLIEKLTLEQRKAYDYMVGQDQKGLIIIFPQPDRDLTGGKLVNPVQDQNKGTTLTTPDQSDRQGATNTGNTGGIADADGNTTVTPRPDGPGKDDLAYLDKPANLSPEGSARAGAFNEAKRQSGIPVSQSPSKVYPNVDRRKNPQPGYIYMSLMYQNQAVEPRKYIFVMMPVVISLQMTQVKIGGHILMMKKVTTMIINYVRRYAESISIKNDICDFSDLIPEINGISAVSWELPNCSRREFGERLLKDIYTVVTDDDFIHVMVQLVPEQPNNAIVNYKKHGD